MVIESAPQFWDQNSRKRLLSPENKQLLPQTSCLLSGPTARAPPYRAIGYSYTYRTYVFRLSQGIAL